MKINGDDITFMLDLLWRIPHVVELNIDGVLHRVHRMSITSVYQNFNPERVAMFPRLFKYLRENLLDKYYSTYSDWNKLPQKGRNIYVNLSVGL